MLDEQFRILVQRSRNFAGPCIVEDDFTIPSEAVCHHWITTIEVTQHVLVEDQENSLLLTKAAVRETNAVDQDQDRFQ